MAVAVDLVGGPTRTVAVEDHTTYGELLAPLEVTREEVAVLVDGRPVPADESVDPTLDRVRVIRLLKGG